MSLQLDWCTHDAAKYAVEHWHYSRCLPSGKLVKVGVWEDDQYIGCVMYSYGANRNLAMSFNLSQTEVCELTRVALRAHTAPVSKILAISLRMLRKHCPGVKIVVSYADTEQHHTGSIYQASNWIYVGSIQEGEQSGFIIHGRKMHPRSVGSKGWVQSLSWLQEHIDPEATRVLSTGKHKYLWIFDEELKLQYMKEHRPYPKKITDTTACATSETSDTPADQAGKGGAAPTVALNQS